MENIKDKIYNSLINSKNLTIKYIYENFKDKDIITKEDFIKIINDNIYFSDDFEQFKIILNGVENIPQKLKDMSLKNAIFYSNIKNCKYLIDNGADLELKSLGENTPVYMFRNIKPHKSSNKMATSGSREIRELINSYYVEKNKKNRWDEYIDSYFITNNEVYYIEIIGLIKNNIVSSFDKKYYRNISKALRYSSFNDFQDIINKFKNEDKLTNSLLNYIVKEIAINSYNEEKIMILYKSGIDFEKISFLKTKSFDNLKDTNNEKYTMFKNIMDKELLNREIVGIKETKRMKL